MPSYVSKLSVRHACFSSRRLFLLVLAAWVVIRIFRGQSSFPQLDGANLFGDGLHTSQSNKHRFAVTTFITDETSYTHLALKNKQHYARKHGYDFIVDYDAPQRSRSSGIWWHKFAMLQRLIHSGHYEWIWWIDFDSLITNTSIPLSEIVNDALRSVENSDDVDFIMSNDCNNLNTGSMLVRSSRASMALLVETFIYGDSKPDLSEQSAMRDLIVSQNMVQTLPSEIDNLSSTTRRKEDPKKPKTQLFKQAVRNGGKKSVLMVPQCKINAFPEEIACYDEEERSWEHGMFVLHFAGAWAYVDDDDAYGVLMRKYEKYIIW